MKRNYLFFGFAVLLCLTVPAQSFATIYNGSCGESVNWRLDTETGLLEITGSGKMEDYGYTPSGSFCDAPWYKYSSNIKECVIENGVTSIGSRAFLYCTGLTSITIPNSVTSIGGFAFNGTPWLNNQSDGLIYINKVCYYYKGEMPENTTIIIKEGTTSIGEHAFYFCTGLTSITIPESVTSIGYSAFSGCTRLTSINVDKNNPNYCSQNGVLFTKDMKSINCVLAGKTGDYSIPNSVTSIGSYAFFGCTGLTSVTIPESVTSIGEGAFYGCTGLTSITIPESVTSIGKGAFYGCTGLTNITIPESVTSIGSSAFSDCTGLTSITIPESVTSIGNSAFEGCTGLTSITIPESVTSIGERAFLDCTGLTSVTIPNSVTSIGDWAFYDCTGLTSITISESVTSIGYSAFYECSGLTNITIPESVTSIGVHAFSYCSGLTSITIPESVTSIGDAAFIGCSQLKTVINFSKLNITKGSSSYGYVAYYADRVINAPIQIDDFFFKESSEGNTLVGYIGNETAITLPKDYKGESYCIGDSAFYDCSELTSITIPNSVTRIGNRAFYDCDGLTSVTIPESVTSIGDWAFYDCTGLTSITIPESVTSIGNSAFGSCSGLTSINVDKNNPNYCSQNGVLFTKDMKSIICVPAGKTGEYSIPNSVTSIGSYAFYGYTGLTSVTIPESVTSIGSYAFSGCTGLTGVIMGKGVTSIGLGTFANNSNLVSITCYSQTSPKARRAFIGISSEAILYYPKGSDYSAWAPYFAQMIEMDETGINAPKVDKSDNTTYDIYDMSGRTVRKAATTTDGLKAGLYIINGRKVLVE